MSKSSKEDAHFAALGRVAAGSALLEDRMSLFLWKLISPDQLIGQIVTAGLSFQQLATLLSTLGKHRIGAGKHYQELTALLKRADKAEARRNTLIHSIWGDDLGAAGRRRIKLTAKRRKGLDWQFEPVTPKQMLDIAEELNALADAFDDLLCRLPSSLTGIVTRSA